MSSYKTFSLSIVKHFVSDVECQVNRNAFITCLSTDFMSQLWDLTTSYMACFPFILHQQGLNFDQPSSLPALFDILLNLFGKRLLGCTIWCLLSSQFGIGARWSAWYRRGCGLILRLLWAVKLYKYLETYLERYNWPRHHSQPSSSSPNHHHQ